MSTFGELTDSTLLFLSGFSNAQDQATYLTAGVTSSATTIPVFDGSALSRGLVEIDDELLWVDTVDTSANQLTVPPYGRGYRSTTAATHASGARVVAAPMFPRSMVKRSINEAILGVYPDLFAVKEYSFTYQAGVYTYSLPADVDTVLWVKWQDVTAASDWVDVRRFSVDSKASTSVFPNGQSLTINNVVLPGRTVRVVYAAQPTVLSNDSDSFVGVSGLPASVEDIIRLGAASRMIAFLDTAHMTGFNAEADFASNMRPAGGAQNLARYLLQNYQMRLGQESGKLQGQFPVRVRYMN